jgi:hypothetical protein
LIVNHIAPWVFNNPCAALDVTLVEIHLQIHYSNIEINVNKKPDSRTLANHNKLDKSPLCVDCIYGYRANKIYFING